MENIAMCIRLASLFLVLLSILLFVMPFPGVSQTITTGDVTGTVTDSTGAVVPGATVTIRDLATNEVRDSITNGEGRYRFTFLKPGRYSVSAASAGMKTGT